MAAMLVNAFAMRDDVEAYHLGGMGCSMGVVGLNLVRDLLAVSAPLACSQTRAMLRLATADGRLEQGQLVVF